MNGRSALLTNAVVSLMSIVATFFFLWLTVSGKFVTEERVLQLVDQRMGNLTLTLGQMTAATHDLVVSVDALKTQQATMSANLSRAMEDIRAQRK